MTQARKLENRPFSPAAPPPPQKKASSLNERTHKVPLKTNPQSPVPCIVRASLHSSPSLRPGRGLTHTRDVVRLLRDGAGARHAAEGGDLADAVVLPAGAAGRVVAPPLGGGADPRAVAVVGLDGAAVRGVLEQALAVGARLGGEGHGQQGEGERGDADHLEVFPLRVVGAWVVFQGCKSDGKRCVGQGR